MREFLPEPCHKATTVPEFESPPHTLPYTQTQRHPASPFSSSYMHKHTHTSLTASDSGQRYRDTIYSNTHDTRYIIYKDIQTQTHKNETNSIQALSYKMGFHHPLDVSNWAFQMNKSTVWNCMHWIASKQHWVIIIILSCICLSLNVYSTQIPHKGRISSKRAQFNQIPYKWCRKSYNSKCIIHRFSIPLIHTSLSQVTYRKAQLHRHSDTHSHITDNLGKPVIL